MARPDFLPVTVIFIWRYRERRSFRASFCFGMCTLSLIRPRILFAILLVVDLLHPVDHTAVLPLLDGDVRHRCRGRSAMPVFLARREPDHIAGTDLLDRSAFPLSPTATSRDDESLTERMRVPCSPRTRLERHARALNKCWIRGLKKRINSDRASEPVGRSLGRRL